MARDLDFDFLGLPSEREAEKIGELSVTDKVGIFPMKNPWVYLPLPVEYSDKLQFYQKVGSLIPISARTGNTAWQTSIAPMGKSCPPYRHFIPLKAAARKAENIQVGDEITVFFSLR